MEDDFCLLGSDEEQDGDADEDRPDGGEPQAELQNVNFLHRSFLPNQIYPKKKRVNRDRFFLHLKY